MPAPSVRSLNDRAGGGAYVQAPLRPPTDRTGDEAHRTAQLRLPLGRL